MTAAVSVAVSLASGRGPSAPVEPETILPEQFFSSRMRHLWGERRLVFAVLEEALACYRGSAKCGRTREQRLFREAEEWFRSEDTEPFSFLYVCDVLDLDPGYVRGALARLAAVRRCATGGEPTARRTRAHVHGV